MKPLAAGKHQHQCQPMQVQERKKGTGMEKWYDEEAVRAVAMAKPVGAVPPAAERLLANLEKKARDRADEYNTVREEVPSLYGLVRRVQYLKSVNDPKYASDIRAAELAIQKAAGDINTLAPDLNKLNLNVKKAYDDIDKILVEMGPSRKALADEWSVADNRRIRRKGGQEAQGYVLSNGQSIKIPRLESENHLGTSYKAEISNRHTREIELLGDKAFASRTQILGRRTPDRITPVYDPLYFDELAYTVNNYVGDAEVPSHIHFQAELIAASELFHRRSAPNGIAQFASMDGQPVRVGRDPLAAVYPLLLPFCGYGV